MILRAPKRLECKYYRYFKTFGSQIKTEDSLKIEELFYDFWLKTLRKFRNRLAA